MGKNQLEDPDPQKTARQAHIEDNLIVLMRGRTLNIVFLLSTTFYSKNSLERFISIVLSYKRINIATLSINTAGLFTLPERMLSIANITLYLFMFYAFTLDYLGCFLRNFSSISCIIYIQFNLPAPAHN